MEKLTFSLNNCYGIRHMQEEVDFSGNGAVAIYAPNGAMKTSFAQTLQDLAEGKAPLDRLFPDRVSTREVLDELGAPLDPSAVVVIKSLTSTFAQTEKTALLLVNTNLRQQYEKLISEIDRQRAELVRVLKKQSGIKNVESEIASAFVKDGDFIKALRRARPDVDRLKEIAFSGFKYDLIFGEKPEQFLARDEVRAALHEYIKNYNALLAKSTYFKRGVFNFYNASTIAKNLVDNGFFNASHTVRFNGSATKDISSAKELEQLIQAERDSISNDPSLKKAFEAIEAQFNQRKELRDLHEYLLNNEELIAHLGNLAKLKEDVWISHLKSCESALVALLDREDAAQAQLEEVRVQAEAEQNDWDKVIAIFNERFNVPFKFRVRNRVQVATGQDRVPTLGFSFEQGGDSVEVEEAQLTKALSTGELRAFYLLTVVFEVEVRRKTGQKTLFVIDDIADSFDYRNKYAILEYLQDIADDPNAYQLVLTHNFDFFRSVSKYVDRQRCHMVIKSPDRIELVKAEGINNVFEHWKAQFFQDDKMRIGCIPFMRNLTEYTLGKQNDRYALLTAMLHFKPESRAVGPVLNFV